METDPGRKDYMQSRNSSSFSTVDSMYNSKLLETVPYNEKYLADCRSFLVITLPERSPQRKPGGGVLNAWVMLSHLIV
jgi:hypothetical protein